MCFVYTLSVEFLHSVDTILPFSPSVTSEPRGRLEEILVSSFLYIYVLPFLLYVLLFAYYTVG